MRSNHAAALAGIGGLLAIVSIVLPWYNTGPFTFNLLNALKPAASRVKQVRLAHEFKEENWGGWA